MFMCLKLIQNLTNKKLLFYETNNKEEQTYKKVKFSIKNTLVSSWAIVFLVQ